MSRGDLAGRRTVALVNAILPMLERHAPDVVHDAIVNVMARVLAVHSPTLADAIELAESARLDISHALTVNWPNIERERAANGGRAPMVQ